MATVMVILEGTTGQSSLDLTTGEVLEPGVLLKTFVERTRKDRSTLSTALNTLKALKQVSEITVGREKRWVKDVLADPSPLKRGLPTHEQHISGGE